MREIDELNNLSEDEIFDIDDYFDEMELSEDGKDERKKFAKDMKEIMLFLFALFLAMKENGYMDKRFIISQLQSRYSDLVLEYMKIDKYIEEHIKEFSEETVDTTLKHIDEEFYLSEDRGVLISINEANNALNYKDFSNAIADGKTEKQWITEKDQKVRKTHKRLDDAIIPINDTFVVGDTLMRFPHDTLYGIDYKELSNCRCTVRYI